MNQIEVVIIDEISMVKPSLIDAIDVSLRKNGGHQYRYFGGKQLVIIGDIGQLQPINKTKSLLNGITKKIDYFEKQKNNTDKFWDIKKLDAIIKESKYKEEQLLKKSFWEAEVIKKLKFKIIRLTENFRQKDDKTFTEVLNNIRVGLCSDNDLKLINSRVIPDFANRDINSFFIENPKTVFLATTLKIVNKINNQMLETLSGETKIHNAIITNHFPANEYPTLEKLNLKIGAKVVILKNDKITKFNPIRRYVNGTIGYIIKFTRATVTVQTETKMKSIIQFRRNIWEYETSEIEIINGKEVKTITESQFIQFPLNLAWALTIHKAQGSTLPNVIVDLTNTFADGQAYVALSRCTSFENLQLAYPIKRSDIKANKLEFECESALPKISNTKIQYVKKAIEQHQRIRLNNSGLYPPVIPELSSRKYYIIKDSVLDISLNPRVEPLF